MSDTVPQTPTDAPAKNKSGTIVFLVIGMLLIGGLLLLATQSGSTRDRLLNGSAMGVQAAAPWLDENGVATRSSHPRLSPSISDLSFRVFALYDLNLFSFSGTPDNREDRLNTVSLRDITYESFWTKVEELPTLVLLPKWSGAFLEAEIAHEQSLIPLPEMTSLMSQLGLEGAQLRRGGPEFVTETVLNGESLTLFYPQVFDRESLPKTCSTVLKFQGDALVISCEIESVPHDVFFASDPDVLNNHGLAISTNGTFGIELISALRGFDERPVYIDRSSELLTALEREDERQDYERNNEEFKRFFEYPFTLFWAAILIVLAVLFWRGSLRFGPLFPNNGQTREMSKRAAIAAKARLLRLSGNDGRMVSDFVRAQIQDLATRSFGRDLGQEAEERFLALLTRNDPELGRDFSGAARTLIDTAATMPPNQLHRALANYHSLLRKVVDRYGPV